MRLIDADALVSLEEVKHKGCAYIEEINNAPTIDAVPVVRCKDCKWYDPPHIEYNDGTRKDITGNDEWVTADIGLNVGGKCYNFAGEYCLSHDREDPDDYEELVKFRGLMDFCSNGERKEK